MDAAGADQVINGKRVSSWCLPLNLAVVLVGLSVGFAFLPFESEDHVRHYNHWMAEIQRRGLSGLAGEFADYAPSYLYVMALISELARLVGTPVAMKLANLPFLALAAYAVRRIVGTTTGDWDRANLAAAALFVLPTVVVNAFYWGQTDIIFGAFVLLFVAAILDDRSRLACFWLGLALAFKLQTVFLAPLGLYLLATRRLKLQDLAICAATFGAMMIPAALAGRPLGDLARVYVDQAETYAMLSMYAPNLWYLVVLFGQPQWPLGSVIGIAAALVATLAIAVFSVRHVRGRDGILLLAAVSVTIVPFLLPRMHDRYFFLADLLLFTLAMASPRYWWLALLAQLGSLLAYNGFLRYVPSREFGGLLMWPAVLAFTVATIGLLAVLAARRSRQHRLDDPHVSSVGVEGVAVSTPSADAPG